jgi:hypothetical protein
MQVGKMKKSELEMSLIVYLILGIIAITLILLIIAFLSNSGGGILGSMNDVLK